MNNHSSLRDSIPRRRKESRSCLRLVPVALSLLAARPAAVLTKGSIVHDHRDTGGLRLGRGFRVDDAVLHPDVLDADLDGLVDHRRHQL